MGSVVNALQDVMVAEPLVDALEADDLATVDAFMQPFAMAGEVKVLPASRCEVVVARGGCD